MRVQLKNTCSVIISLSYIRGTYYNEKIIGGIIMPDSTSNNESNLKGKTESEIFDIIKTLSAKNLIRLLYFARGLTKNGD
jgi:hypothetical protein